MLTSTSPKRERSTSALPEPATLKFEGGNDVVRLFEEHSVVVGNHVVVKEEVLVKEEGDFVMDYEMKEEDSVTIVAGSSSSHSVKSSPSPGVGDDDHSSASPPTGTKSRVKKEKPGPQLIGHLPRAEEAAMKTFIEMELNHYQYNTLGRSREANESMTCDCQYEHGESILFTLYTFGIAPIV